MDRMQRPEVRWGLGCLLSGVAFAGLLGLVLFVAILIQPPAWLQIALGLAIVAGAAIFTWILASALGTSDRKESSPGPDGPPGTETEPDIESEGDKSL